MTVQICIVNASTVLSDAEAAAIVPALQLYDDTMLAPEWGLGKCLYSFQNWAAFEQAPVPGAWPVFLNRHSTDASALGWHDDQSGLIFGRCFVGDCLRYAVSWTVDVSHEVVEMRIDPTIDRIWKMPDGRGALMEGCDPVEDDIQAIDVNGVKLSNFVLPAYFSTGPGPYDYLGKTEPARSTLRGPCPDLTPGGYQSITDWTSWTQVTAMLLGGPPSYRSVRYHHGRRLPRSP